ncbi:golvesin C-terminal-like domain-containing protein [Sediminitomix flava]|nr:family 10 glycosylhydrolase [Sediminitomix flava]
MKHIYWRALLLTLFFGYHSLHAQEIFKNKLQNALRTAWEKTSIPGIGLAVSTPDQGMIFTSVGIGNIYTNSAITEESRFLIASNSKTFTAALVLRLQDAGYFDIDDKLSDHLIVSGLPNNYSMTIRQLLNHSAGVYDHFNNSNYWSLATAQPYKVFTDAEVMSYSNALGPSFSPGSSYSYSNAGFYLLGMLVEAKLGISAREAMDQWVIQPMGLDLSFLDDSSDPSNKIPYLAENSRAYEYHKSSITTAGSMVATPQNVAQFAKAVFSEGFLSSSSLNEMIAPSTRNSSYGLGTRRFSDNGVTHYGHTGTLAGYKSYMYYIPSMDVSVAMHANAYTDPSSLWFDIVDAVFDVVTQEYGSYCQNNNCNAPSRPRLLTSKNNVDGSFTLEWIANTETDLSGYRIYYSTSDNLSNWQIAANEASLSPSTSSFTFSSTSAFEVPTAESTVFLKLVAVGDDGLESESSDVYVRSDNANGKKVLIVDGFDRTGGSASWGSVTHNFAADYLKVFRDAEGSQLSVSSIANEALTSGLTYLQDYDMVIWFLGDESTIAETFSDAEQALVKTYLENGGKLLVTGSEIGWDLSAKGSSTDQNFYNNYLKANYVDDGSISYTPATGITSTLFEGTVLNFGQVYQEDYPDAISPQSGAEAIFNYASAGKQGGVAYKGTFGSSQEEGGVVYLSFPLETVSDQSSKVSFAGQLLDYFDLMLEDGTPTAKFVVSGLPAGIGTSLDFDASTSSDSDGSIAQYAWDFGDGSSATGLQASHFYQANGSYTVKLTVTDNDGKTSTKTQLISVSSEEELRGTWYTWTGKTPPTNAEINTAMQQIASGNFNIVYVPVWKYGMTYFPSDVLQSELGIDRFPEQGSRDVLAEMITAGHNNGLKVVAWFEWGFAGGTANEPIVTQKPEWITEKQDGTKSYDAGVHWLIHVHPEVQAFLTDLGVEVVSKYDIDGIQMDRIRFPSLDCSYDDFTSGMYLTEKGTLPPSNTSDANFQRWRADKLNDFMARFYDRMKEVEPNISVSNAPIVYPYGYDNFCQDWPQWVNSDHLDYAIPQVYRNSNSVYSSDLNGQLSEVNDNSKVVPGMTSVFNGQTIPSSTISAKINTTRSRGLDGQVIWYHTELVDDYAYLQANNYQTQAFLPPKASYTGFVHTDCPIVLPMKMDSESATLEGGWNTSTSQIGYLGANYLHDGNADKGNKKVIYTAVIPTSGTYEVFTLHTANTNRATNVPFDITHYNGVSTVLVNQQQNHSKWVSLGSYDFAAGPNAKIELKTTGTNGYVIADAIRLVFKECQSLVTPSSPIVVADNAVTDEDNSVAISVLANDDVVEGTWDFNSIALTAPQNGTASVDNATGVVTYTPNANFFGNDSLSYRVANSVGGVSEYQKIYVTVNPINDLPSAQNDQAELLINSSVVIDVLANDSDIEGLDVSSVTVTSNPQNGQATVNSTTGEITYTPNSNYSGVDNLVYQVADSDGALASAQVSITINDTPQNPPAPCASDSHNSTYEWIANVSVGSYSNTSSNDNGYGDYTANPIYVVTGESYGLSLTPGFLSSSYQEHWKVWIDFNADGDFDDAGEELFDTYGTGTSAVTGTITIPFGVSSGLKIMRVGMNGTSADYTLTPCNAFTYGEVEDYYVDLTNNGCVPPAVVSELIDNDAPEYAETGSWISSTSTSGYIGAGYRHDGDANKGSMAVTYSPNISVDGDYEVFVYYTAGSNRATNVPIEINHAQGQSTVTVNQQINNTTWVSLGTYSFTTGSGSAVMKNDGTDGVVIADAMRFDFVNCASPASRRQVQVEIQDEHTDLAYPNPFSDHLSIAWESNEVTEATISIYDAVGNLITTNNVQTKIGSNSTDFNTSNLANGLYFVKLNSDIQNLTFKVIKQ